VVTVTDAATHEELWHWAGTYRLGNEEDPPPGGLLSANRDLMDLREFFKPLSPSPAADQERLRKSFTT